MGLFNFLFRKMCNRIFHVVDADKSGYIEVLEVEVAIYRMYNIINKRIPGWSDPPSRKDILGAAMNFIGQTPTKTGKLPAPQFQAALKAYDSNIDGRLDKAEFQEFSRSLGRTVCQRKYTYWASLAQVLQAQFLKALQYTELVKSGPDMFFARVGRDAAMHTAVLPVATKGLQEVAGASGWSAVANLPLHVAAPMVGSLFSAVRALIPIGL